MKHTWMWLLGLGLSFAMGCGEEANILPPDDMDSADLPDGWMPPANLALRVNPLTATDKPMKLVPGGSLRLRARVFNGQELLVQTETQPVIVDWTSADENVVTVDAAGVAIGVAAGSTTVTARVRGSQVTQTVHVDVVDGDLMGVFVEPERALVDINGQFNFALSAIDRLGAPRPLECEGGAKLAYDHDVMHAEYDGTLGQERLHVEGIKTGFTVVDLRCNNLDTTPTIVEVKPSVTIPHPSPANPGDFGVDADIVLADGVIHMASFDRATQSLVYSVFNRKWSSQYLEGGGEYGRVPRVILDPLNDDQPMICATEGADISCWSYESSGFWQKQSLGLLLGDMSYAGDLSLAVNSRGEVLLLAHDAFTKQLIVARSSAANRDDWSVERLPGATGYHGIAIEPTTQEFRIAMSTAQNPRFPEVAGGLRYGAFIQGAWVFETVDSEAEGQGVKLGLGTDGRPQLVYYKNGNIIHAARAGGQWRRAVIASVQTDQFRFGFGLSWHNEPRVSFYDSTLETLRYAYRLRPEFADTTNRWRLEQPIEGRGLGQQSALALDEQGRAHIAFYDQSREQVRYFVEPHFLDYAPYEPQGAEPLSNTLPNAEVAFCSGQATDLKSSQAHCGACGNMCAQGARCTEGQCSCPEGQGECEGVCTDLSTITDCGQCDNKCAVGGSCKDKVCICPDGQEVCEGQCTPINTTSNCGTCGNVCAQDGVCLNGQCSCPGTQGAVCDGVCYDLFNDINNCGACDNVCAQGGVCLNGECACLGAQNAICNGICRDLTKVDNCGACGNVCAQGASCTNAQCVCPTNQFTCNGICKSLATTTDCGTCGNVCAQGASCTSGQCACPAGQVVCNGICRDLNTSTSSCGTCDNRCPGGANCINGQCACPAGTTLCNNACVNLNTNEYHCGTCSNECSVIGSSCDLGQCKCSYGLSVCNNSCVNINNDNNNCGACNNKCPQGATCGSNQCTCPVGQVVCNNKCVDLKTDSSNCGQCGRIVPGICVQALPVNVTQISAGGEHTCAILENNTLFCWGKNTDGQLGDGTNTRRWSPVKVSGLNNVVQVSAGWRHTCALLSNGTVSCWGYNSRGQLGDNSTISRMVPTTVNGLSGVTQISAGRQHTCALLSNGTARCWGYNIYGGLGDGTTIHRSSPVLVNNLSSINHLSAGEDHTCAVLNDSTARCWGYNFYGQLGDGSYSNSLTPVVVKNRTIGVSGMMPTSGISLIHAGRHHTCAFMTNGSVLCAGDQSRGQLGDNISGYNASKNYLSIASKFNIYSASQLSVGELHTCTVLSNNIAGCWGDDDYGQVTGSDGTYVTEITFVNDLGNVTKISAGSYHTCALSTDKTVRCWGRNSSGQLGDGTTTVRTKPVSVVFQ